MDAVECDRPYSLNRCAVSRRRFIALCGLFIGTALVRPGGAAPVVERRANARSLRLYNTHTGERLRIVYWEPKGHQPGGYLEDALADINYLLRDRTGAVHRIDPSLLDLLHELSAARHPGSIPCALGFSFASDQREAGRACRCGKPQLSYEGGKRSTFACPATP